MTRRFALGLTFRAAVVWAAIAAPVSGCGGQAVEEGTGGGSSSGSSTSSGSSSSARGGASGTGTDLPACVEGREPDTGTCPWLGSDGLCYDDKLSACACSCPRDRDSVCSSGLPGGDYSMTRVDCY